MLILLLGSGCSGVLFEKKLEGGRVDRLKIDGGEGWSEYDDKPRYPQSKTKDEYYIVIKKEATF
ncbi:MAG: hypothetical protein HY790_05615 [Deltaproteobacteria bacterium]|nr:hypothetical protein [Deltaproteobacteria bacterium]